VRPIIALLPDRAADADRVHCAAAYLDAVADAGGIPVVLPHRVDFIDDLIARCDGVVLIGGDDPNTEPFGEAVHPAATVTHPARQQYELTLLGALDRTRVPVLGICLGMQMMALHHGGRLHQHLPDDCGPAVAARHLDGPHEIRCSVADHPWLPRHAVVHSHHHQAVADPGAMRICARSEDDLIEAIDLPDQAGRFYLGVQWHPERTEERAVGAMLFEQLIACAGRSRT
jgi:putative glutamine amidotransferase